jgi:beta-mannosidase
VHDRHYLDLTGDWLFAYGPVPAKTLKTLKEIQDAGLQHRRATVPGNFELDLQQNGIISDPFFGMNIVELRNYESTHVWYARQFSVTNSPGFVPSLMFEGLDTYASIYLNGELIGETDNMLVEHLFSVEGKLKPVNELVVHIRPAFDEARKFDYSPNAAAARSCYESLYVRKAAHMYGWDIMPRALSAGIWRPVTLQFLPSEHLANVYVRTVSIAQDRSKAHLILHYGSEIAASCSDIYEISMAGQCNNSVINLRERILFGHGLLNVNVPNPELWWPRGRGAANLYKVEVALLKNGVVLDSQKISFGIRTSELIRTSLTDSQGSGEFVFIVNGEKVFALGTNWVPLDAYHSRDRGRIPAAIDMVEDIGCNMIRCWGGNVYEDDLFYDLCDEKGILVWQDFAMACAVYPQNGEFANMVADEARKVVRRLRNHPCIAIWAGDNECDQAYGWYNTGVDPNSNVLTRQVLPTVVRQESGASTSYIPSSPYYDETAYRSPGKHGPNTPEAHLWGPRNYYKSEYYTDFDAHFASEMGYHGCPSPGSLAKFISPNKLWPYQDNEEWRLHSTAPIPGMDIHPGRVELMETQVKALFGSAPENLAEYSFASQATQAEAFKFFIESFRIGKWRRTGIIWWNLIDGWPQLSDAVVDYYYEKKLAYDTIKQSQSPLLIAMREPKNESQDVVAVNDTREDLPVRFTIASVLGLAVAEGRTVVPADSAFTIATVPYAEDKQILYNLLWSSPLGEGRNYYLAGKPPFDLLEYRRWMAKLRL